MKIEINTLPLFPVLDGCLLALLQSLRDEDWEKPTICSRWTVKDIAAHLLDGNIRGLATSRDGYFGLPAPEGGNYGQLVEYINRHNMNWTTAARRISPRILIRLLEITGHEYNEHLADLDPFGDAIFPVAWAGQDRSPNWLHTAREYSEKFLHQQQIRDALNRPGIMTRQFFYPFLDTLMYGLPHTFRDTQAEEGTRVNLEVTGDVGGIWSVVKKSTGWQKLPGDGSKPNAHVRIDPDTAWKLFSGSRKPQEVLDRVRMEGDKDLGQQALRMVSFMVA